MTLTYSSKKKFHFLFFVFFAFLASGLQAQTAPENTRLMQTGSNFTQTYTKHLHSQKSDLFFTGLSHFQANFFGEQVSNGGDVKSRHIARLGEDGLPRWSAKFFPEKEVNSELNISDDFSCTDLNDNFLFLSNVYGNYDAAFTEATGNTINFTQNLESTKLLIKIDKNGNYLWSKKVVPSSSTSIQGAVTTDNNGDVYLILLKNNSGASLTIDNTTLGSTTPTLSLIKLNGIDGSIIYSKNYNYRCYSFLPVFDAQNNLYVFTEPIENENNYVFDNTIIPTNTQWTGHLMLKFSTQGDVIFGKNFYANATNYYYSWPNDVVFDGTDFILNGTLLTNSSSNFAGLDGLTIPRSYTGNTTQGLLAKINTSGNVLWQKPVETNINSHISTYTNIDVDENHNFYIYYSGVKDKMKINGTEYNFDTVKGEKILIKFDTDGNQAYLKSVDYGNSHSSIDVFGVDKINVNSYTKENNILGYPINNFDPQFLVPKAYVATFGTVTTPYLKPVVNYSEINNVAISNNGSENTTFSFDLVNNVIWTATSDQPWLTLSHLNLTGRNQTNTTISGNADAKITLTAEPNTMGSDRTATVTINGTGVATKTILVTQSGTLSTPSNEFNANILVLYPNPAHSTIAFSEAVKDLEIIDVSGKTIKIFQGFNSTFTINDLAKGIYFVKGKTKNDIRFTKKLIKE